MNLMNEGTDKAEEPFRLRLKQRGNLEWTQTVIGNDTLKQSPNDASRNPDHNGKCHNGARLVASAHQRTHGPRC